MLIKMGSAVIAATAWVITNGLCDFQNVSVYWVKNLIQFYNRSTDSVQKPYYTAVVT